jgi:hypothetical protein
MTLDAKSSKNHGDVNHTDGRQGADDEDFFTPVPAGVIYVACPRILRQ